MTTGIILWITADAIIRDRFSGAVCLLWASVGDRPQIEPGTSATTYQYGGDGKRRARAVNGTTTTRYRWGLGWDLLNEENGGGTLTNMHIGHLAEVPGSNPATGAYRYYATDLIRSTRALFDQNKAEVAGYEYTPYGELYGSSGSVSTTHRFTGHDWDATCGLYFAPYRYYRPDMARWLSPDPAGFVDGLNVYGYVQGNPVAGSDPLGLRTRAPGEPDPCEATGERGGNIVGSVVRRGLKPKLSDVTECVALNNSYVSPRPERPTIAAFKTV